MSKSLFRLARSNSVKAENIPLAAPGPVSATSASIAGSHRWIATPHGSSGSSVFIAPTDFSKYTREGSPAVISAHGNTIGDMCFDPFNPDTLLTGAEDGVVKVWSIPTEGLTENLTKATHEIKVSGGVRAIKANPAANGIYAVASKGGLQTIDATQGDVVNTFGANSGFGKDIMSCGWNQDGSLLSAVSKDSNLRCFDPRVAGGDALTIDGATIDSRKPHHTMWLNTTWGGSAMAVLAQDKTHKPYMAFYDGRDLTKPLHTKRFDFSSGYTIPAYDPDTNMFFVTLRGSTIVQVYDLCEKDGGIDAAPVMQMGFNTASKGMCLLPKSTVNTDRAEIGRIMNLTDRTIEPYSIVVPRKHLGYHEELYPRTRDVEPALQAAAWREKGTSEVKDIDVLGLIEKLNGVSISEEKDDDPVAALPATEVTTTRATGGGAKPGHQRVVSTTRATINNKLRTSKLLHIGAKESESKSDIFFDIKTNAQHIPCGRNISCNNKWLGINWKSGGSHFYVRPIDAPERAPMNPPGIKCVMQTITSHDFSMLNDDQLAVGSLDGKLMVFNLPANGKITEHITECSVNLLPDNDGGKVTCVKYSATVSDLLAVSVSSDRHILLLFNTLTGKNPYCLASEHEDQIMDIAFDPYSHLLATTCKDGFVRVIDPRGDTCVKFQPNECVRDCRAHWIDREHLAIAGTAKASRRGVSIWNWKTQTEVKSHYIDVNSTGLISRYDFDHGLLFCASMGDRQCRVFEISPWVFPFIAPMDEYKMNKGQFCGMAWLHNSTTDPKKVELGRSLKLTQDSIVLQSWTIPRKRMDFFQDDILKPILSNKAAMSADDWFAHKSPEGEEPATDDTCPAGMVRLSDAPVEELTDKQMRYQKHLIKRDEGEATSEFMGKKTDAQVRDHFRTLGETLPAAKWDKSADVADEVDDDEWSD